MMPIIKKPKVAIFSDLHLGVHSNSSDWHNYAVEWALWFRDECRDKGIKDLIFAGDWHHNRSEISVNTLQISADILDILSEFNLIAITGNHDIYYKHRTDVNSLSIFKNRNNVTVLEKYETIEAFDKKISFCPWNTATKDIEESDLIVGHFEIETFKMNTYKTCEEGVKVKDLLKKSELVISGHFHTRHEKKFGAGTILYVGNPFQMDFGDAGNQKGYHILDIDTMEYEFFANNISPNYNKISLSELVEAGEITSFIRSRFTNNIVKVKIDMNISQEDMDILQSTLVSLKPEVLTYDYDINFNRILDNKEDIEDLSGVDIEQAIEEFINSLEPSNKKSIIDYTLGLYESCKV
jgi:DNA repair exonuclease SbcCD nuclease subunit|tara:strand:- start:150 stop:1205 length:1056 start_codon:yes stop_codon:yes gene_type:complete